MYSSINIFGQGKTTASDGSDFIDRKIQMKNFRCQDKKKSIQKERKKARKIKSKSKCQEKVKIK